MAFVAYVGLTVLPIVVWQAHVTGLVSVLAECSAPRDNGNEVRRLNIAHLAVFTSRLASPSSLPHVHV